MSEKERTRDSSRDSRAIPKAGPLVLARKRFWRSMLSGRNRQRTLFKR